MLCGPKALRKDSADRVCLVSLPCNGWECPSCGPRRRWRCAQEVIAGRPDKTMTLTLGTADGLSPLEHRAMFARFFPRLIRQLCRYHRIDEIPYWYVIEKHKSGHPHMHVALRMPWTEWEDLKAMWLKISGSPGVTIQMPRSVRGIAKYLSKYLAKDAQKYGDFKRYVKSRNWILEPVQKKERRRLCKDEGFRIVARNIELEVQGLMHQGYCPIGSIDGVMNFMRPGYCRDYSTGPP